MYRLRSAEVSLFIGVRCNSLLQSGICIAECLAKVPLNFCICCNWSTNWTRSQFREAYFTICNFAQECMGVPCSSFSSTSRAILVGAPAPRISCSEAWNSCELPYGGHVTTSVTMHGHHGQRDLFKNKPLYNPLVRLAHAACFSQSFCKDFSDKAAASAVGIYMIKVYNYVQWALEIWPLQTGSALLTLRRSSVTAMHGEGMTRVEG